MSRFPPPPSPRALNDDEKVLILERILTPKHFQDPRVVRFVLAYVGCRLTSEAAKKADLTYSQGANLLNKVDVYEAIKELTAKQLMKYGYEADEVIERVKEIVEVDLGDFENPDGTFKTHLSQLDPRVRRAIRKFKAKNIYGEDANGMRTVIGQLIEVELWDKLKSIELLGREKNIFKETKKVEHDITSNMADILLGSRRKADERKALMARDVTQGGHDESQGNALAESSRHTEADWGESRVPESDGSSQSGGVAAESDKQDL
jgi:phage terminase small subunit